MLALIFLLPQDLTREKMYWAGVYKVPMKLISFPPPIFQLISLPRLPYSGGSPPGNFFENWLLKRAFFSRPKLKEKKIK